MRYASHPSATFALSKLPSGLQWGEAGRGSDNLSSYLTYDGKKVLVYIVGETQLFYYDKEKKDYPRAVLKIFPLAEEDGARIDEVVSTFATSTAGASTSFICGATY